MYDLTRLFDADTMSQFEETIKQSHARRIRTLVLDNSFNVREEVTGIVDGTVEVNTSNRPARRLTLKLYRPKTSWQPYDWWFTDNWQVWYEVQLPDGSWVGPPIFAGKMAPGASSIRRSSINSSIVEVAAVGYESRYDTPLGTPRRIPGGWKNTDAIVNILNYYDDLAGHAHSTRAFETSITRLAKDWYYGSMLLGERRPYTTWSACKSLAAGCGGWSIFVDGDFTIILKPPPRTPVATFSVEKKNIVTPPTYEARFDSFVNGIVVHGAEPEGKPRIRGEAWASYPHRPQDLSERWIEEIEELTCGTTEAANSLAEKRLADRLKIGMDVEIDTTIDPRLQEYDWVTIQYGSEVYTVPATSFTIPLTDGSQNISSSRKTAAEKVFAARRRRLVRAR